MNALDPGMIRNNKKLVVSERHQIGDNIILRVHVCHVHVLIVIGSRRTSPFNVVPINQRLRLPPFPEQPDGSRIDSLNFLQLDQLFRSEPLFGNHHIRVSLIRYRDKRCRFASGNKSRRHTWRSNTLLIFRSNDKHVRVRWLQPFDPILGGGHIVRNVVPRLTKVWTVVLDDVSRDRTCSWSWRGTPPEFNFGVRYVHNDWLCWGRWKVWWVWHSDKLRIARVIFNSQRRRPGRLSILILCNASVHSGIRFPEMI